MNAPRVALVALGFLAAANFLGYAARNALFQAYGDLRLAYSVDNEALGQLATAFMFAQAAATIPFGWAGDRFDRRWVIAAGLLVAAAAGIAGPLLGSFELLMVSRALVGLGLAAIVPVANSILSELFEGERKASRIAIFNLGLFFGGAFGFAGGDFIGYPGIVYACAVPAIAVAIGIVCLPIAPRRQPGPGESLPGASMRLGGMRGALRSFLTQARILVGLRSLRWIMVSTTAMAFASGGFTAFFAEFLKVEKQVSAQHATNILIVSLVAGLLGVFVGGRLGDRMRRARASGRLWTIVVGMSATVPSVAACILVTSGPAIVIASMATMFFISWYHAPMAASVDDLARADRAATAQALVVFTMHILGTAPSSWIVGWLSMRVGLGAAMWLPTIAVAIAALAMVRATATFGRETAPRA